MQIKPIYVNLSELLTMNELLNITELLYICFINTNEACIK